MKLKKYLLPLALAVSANSAVAGIDWYYNPNFIVGPFKSPAALCSSLGAGIMNMDPVYVISWPSTSWGRCDNPGGTGFFRKGNTCDNGEEYDNKENGCTPPEPGKGPELCNGGIADILGQCNPQANPDPSPCNPDTEGNPILIATGQKVEIITDIELPNSQLKFKRNYWSSRLDSETIGVAWKHNWQMRIQELKSSDRIKLYRDNGRGIIFRPTSTGWESDSSDRDILTKLPNNQGWKVQTTDRMIELYNSKGQLTSYTADGYPTITLAYNTNDQLTTLTDENSKTLTFTYNAKGLITKVASNTGLAVSYGYDAKDRLISSTKNAKSKIYHYENTQYSNLLTGITDERGIRYATWTYNDKGMAITSEHAGGADKYQFEYLDDSRTRVTNSLGKSAVYHFQNIRLEKKIKKIEGEAINSCTATDTTYRYNAKGQPVYTDTTIYKYGSSNVYTNYEYNDRGLLTKEHTPTNGILKTTKWHDTLPVPVEINNTGRVTTFNYDSEGRLLKTTYGNLPTILNIMHDVAVLQLNDFTDQVGNTWNATGNPKIVNDNGAIAGKALNLDGNSYLTTNVDAFQFGAGNFTIEFWVKIPQPLGHAHIVVDALYFSSYDASLSTYITPEGWVAWHGYQSYNKGVVLSYNRATNIIDNQWHHIAYSRSNGLMRVFVDGKLDSSIEDKNSYIFIPHFTSMAIGARASAKDMQYNFTGFIDQLRITKKAHYTEDFTPSRTPYIYNDGSKE